MSLKRLLGRGLEMKRFQLLLDSGAACCGCYLGLVSAWNSQLQVQLLQSGGAALPKVDFGHSDDDKYLLRGLCAVNVYVWMLLLT